MNENAQFEKLYIFRANPPYIGYDDKDALNLQDHLAIQKAFMEPSQQPVVLHVRPEDGSIVITSSNKYSMHWTAIELTSPGSNQSIPLNDYIVYVVPPIFAASMTVPSELNPSFSVQGISDIIHAYNRPDLNAVSNWRFVRNGQTHNQQKFNISFGTRSLCQLMKKGFMISLGSVKVHLELIGTAFNGIKYGQSEGYKALFSSLYYPYALLDKEDAHKLNFCLHDMKQKILYKDRLPVIESFNVKNGHISVNCLNQFSFDWVVQNAQDQEIKHDILCFNKRFEFNAQIPLANFNAILIKDIIAAENTGLKAYAWKLNLKLQTPQFVVISIICDDESVFNIAQRGFKINFAKGEINLDFVGVVEGIDIHHQ